jgi:pectinesterase
MRKKVLSILCIIIYAAIFLVTGSVNIVSAAVSADIIVAKDGTGKFSTVQSAIDSIPDNNSKKVVIYIKNGTYKEVVTVRKNNLHIIGESNTGTIISYGNYAGKLKPDGTTYGTSGSGTFYLYGKDVILENLKIENSFDESTITADAKQAVAAYINGDRNIIRNCVITGNQDTLYANAGRQYYNKCRIVGDVDFIFGGATAVFEDCEIVSAVRVNGGYVTAASTDISNYGYLFLNCKLTSDAAANSVYLGRPWRKDAYVVYKTCYLGAHIRQVGWTSMSGNLPENARFFEYKNTGPGAVVNSSRRQLSDAQAGEFTVEKLMKGSDNWNPLAVVSSIPTGSITPTSTKSVPTMTPTKMSSTATPTVSSTQNGDLNGDKAINISDVMILASYFNTVKGDARYVEAYDLNRDGAINIGDVMIIAARFNTIV